MRLVDIKELKKHILEEYDQAEIFATYLEVQETDINYCLQNKRYAINNPLREDNDPSLGFMTVLDKNTNCYKLKMYDWADPEYRGDCFDLVAKVRSLNVRNGAEFIAICKDIMYTMKNRTLQNNTLRPNDKQDTFTPMHFEPRLWKQTDIALWNSFGLPFNEHKHLIFPIKNSFISNFCDYRYTEDDPGYAWISGYYDGKTLYTFYFPFRDGKDRLKPRFKKNNKFYPLECIHELKPADILVITKAYKEKLLISRLLPQVRTEHTIQVSNFTSESVILSDAFVLKLYDIYPTIVTNTDFDRTGLYTSGQHKRKYGMMRFIPTNGKYGTYNFNGKDLCEINANFGQQYCVDLLQESYDYIKQQLDLEPDYLF